MIQKGIRYHARRIHDTSPPQYFSWLGDDSNDGSLQVLKRAKTRPLARPRTLVFTGCTCTRSNCLKMYCVCVKAGKVCTAECRCHGCKNTLAYRKATPKVFSDMLAKQIDKPRGCNCNRPCNTNYCECRKRGRRCTEECNCKDGCCSNNKLKVNTWPTHAVERGVVAASCVAASDACTL